MTPRLFSLLLFSLLLNACADKHPEAEAEIAAIAQVQTATLEYTDISPTITAYGSVIALPDNLKALSVPYASRIENVYVSSGQGIRAGDPLLTVQPSEDVLLAARQAQQELESAMQEQKLLQGRFALKLATQHELVTSQLRVDQAKALVLDLTARGSLKSHTFKAEKTGVVATVNAQPGQRVLAGSPLLQWAEQNQWHVSLGVEPGSIEQLKPRQQVLLLPVNRTVKQAIRGLIESIAQQIDPLSHLVTVIVKPASNVNFLLNEAVQGQISLSSKQALVAPRAAVLPDEDGYNVYTVVDNHVIKHHVQLGIETDTQIEVIDPALNAQDDIVVLGNYELTDGMAVEVQKP